jgi:lysine 2,3-aminomutase
MPLGISHLRTSVSKGIEIMEGLRGHTFGFCIPTFVIDAPGGGKIPIMPNYIISQAPGRIAIRNFEGVITTYTEPADYKDECKCEWCVTEKYKTNRGVISLLHGEQLSLEPVELERRLRINHNQ